MSTPHQRVVDFCNALKAAPQFATATYVKQLHYRATQVPDISFVYGFGGWSSILNVEEVLSGRHVMSSDAGGLIKVLAQASTAWSIANLSTDDDPVGFSGCINKSVAERNLVDALTRLLGYCYADHLDEFLISKNMTVLQDLQRDQDFVDAYQKYMLDQETIQSEIEWDVTVGNINYSANILFVSNYFQHQATPKMHESSTIWTQTVGDKMRARINAANQSTAANKADIVKNVVQLVAQSLPIAYGMNASASSKSEYLRPPLSGEILPPLLGMDAPKDIKDLINSLFQNGMELGDWRSWGDILVTLWNNVKAAFDALLGVHAKSQTSHYDSVPSGSYNTPPAGMVTYISGQAVKEFIDRNAEGYPEMIQKTAPRNWDMRVANPLGSCFVAGTKVITKTGAKNIETLAEFDWVLTRGEFDEWGLVSDEKVVVPVENPIIHGFNEEEPFFTSGHIFLTTTGPRALDPILAMRENPWADVGRLAVGHVLLRLNQTTNKYEQVPLYSITSREMPDVQKVYGVHLREGRRSYHANGYMVAVNYPELTMKSICKMLRTVTVEEQAKMMLAFSELKPLFERFGIASISEVLQREIEQESDKNSMRLYKTKYNKMTGPGHLRLNFAPQMLPGIDYSDLITPLPTVSVNEGVVLVDGEACEIASINNMTNEVRWVRPLSKSPAIFEQGKLTVDPLTREAQGDIMYTRDARGQSQIWDTHRFYLTIGEDMEYLPSYEEATGAMNSIEIDASVAGAAFADNQETGYEYAEGEAGEPPMENLAIAGAAAAEDGSIAFEESKQEPDMGDNGFEFLPEPRVQPFLFKPTEYTLLYDERRWKPDRPTMAEPQSFGRIQLLTGKKTTTGLAMRVAVLPELDKLLDLINRDHVDSKLGQLDSLYDSSVNPGADGQVTVRVNLTPNAIELLRRFKDRTEDGDLIITFKEKLKTDVQMAMLFHSIELTLGSDEKTMNGFIWEYSSESDTGEGAKHLLMSDPGQIARPVDAEKRLDESKRAGDINTGSPTTPISTPQKPVPPPPVRQGPDGPMHVFTIDRIPFKQEDIEYRSRRLLEDMMYFHMKKETLSEVFGKQQPTSLPDNLGTNLPSNLRTWITETYGPAFTALQIIENFNTKDWEVKFTEKEKRKILNFWQGNGPKCLSKSTEYKQLNQMSVREAMLQLYSKNLQQFIQDDGKSWAKKYYDEIVSTKLDNVSQNVVNSDSQPLQKYCNVLYCLDPDTLYAKDFYMTVMAKVAAFFGLHETKVADKDAPWLPDAVNWLADALTNPGDDRLKPEVREMFLSAFKDFADQQKLEFDRQNSAVLRNQIVQSLRLQYLLPKGVSALATIGKGAWFRSADVMKNEAWLKSNDLSRGANKWVTTFKLLAVLGTITFLLVKKDMNLTASEKARVGGSIAQNIVDIMSPHLMRKEARTALEIEAETALLNDKIRKTPFGFRRTKLIKEQEKYMEQLGKEAMELEEEAAEKGQGFFRRIRNKVKMPARWIRLLSAAVAMVVIGLLIWDLIAHAGEMSSLQLGLGILNIVLEVAVMVCEVLAAIFPAVSCIPVIGQILVLGVMILGIITMIFGNSTHQKTPGEKFIEDRRKSWLPSLDDPPSPLLSYSTSPFTFLAETHAKKGSTYTLIVDAQNNTDKDIKFIQSEEDLSGEQLSTDSISFATLSFYSGSDETCLFANSAWVGSGETFTAGAGTWSVSVPEESERSKWDITLLKPNGTNLKSTGYQLRIRAKATDGADPKNPDSGAVWLRKGQKLSMTLTGVLPNSVATPIIKLNEARQGAPFAPWTRAFVRDD